jgi:hypothetical protein
VPIEEEEEDKEFRIWVRITTPISLICERINLSAESEITNPYFIINKKFQINRVLILPVALDACESWSLT